MMRGYPIQLEDDDNGTYLVTCALLPELTTYGETKGDAALNAVSAVEEAIGARMADWQDIPAPQQPTSADESFAPLAAQTLLKVELYRLVQASGLTRADLQRQLKNNGEHWHREQVDRLFRLDHASRLDRVQAAFEAVGAEFDITVRSKQSSPSFG